MKVFFLYTKAPPYNATPNSKSIARLMIYQHALCALRSIQHVGLDDEFHLGTTVSYNYKLVPQRMKNGAQMFSLLILNELDVELKISIEQDKMGMPDFQDKTIKIVRQFVTPQNI